MRILIGVLLSTSVTAAAFAGSLTPPGAPAPSMKTLDEVEARIPIHNADLPLVISASGSYYFAEDLSVSVPDTNGIIIAAPEVTIDFNGFALTGAGSAAGSTGYGIRTAAPSEDVVLKNGTIRNWRSDGIYTRDSLNAVLQNLTVANNGGTGIAISTGTVERCSATGNKLSGIIISGPGATAFIKENTCSSNNGNGIAASDSRGVISNNICTENTASGIRITQAFQKVTGNLCENNNSGIVSIWSQNVVEGNTARFNDNAGISSIAGNGLFPDDASLFIRNSAHANDTVNYSFSPASRAGPVVGALAGTGITSENSSANIFY